MRKAQMTLEYVIFFAMAAAVTTAMTAAAALVDDRKPRNPAHNLKAAKQANTPNDHFTYHSIVATAWFL